MPAMRCRQPLALVTLAAIYLSGCSSSIDGRARELPSDPIAVQAVSLLGDTLRVPTLDSATNADRQAAFAVALEAYRHAPTEAESIIWLGRRLAYLGRYLEAIEVFTWGADRFPNDARLYRHRGHRYITTRQFTPALGDFLMATRLLAQREDEVEPDGLPNARGIPTSTLKTNVWYHLGLTHYVRGDYPRAASAYRECLRYSTNPDMDVAATHWLYMSLQRIGQPEQAAEALERIDPDADIIENHSYFDLVMMYKGLRAPEDLLVAARAGDGLANATVAYGLARWYDAQGERDTARDLLEAIVAGSEWAAFGHIAAEADLAAWADDDA
jgi:tetratricopeptide (TPR) repeat protein